jgi:superfamily II DNA/RNA helicase
MPALILLISPMQEVAKRLAHAGVPFKSTLITGSGKLSRQRNDLENTVDLIVSTPGRLLDLKAKGISYILTTGSLLTRRL